MDSGLFGQLGEEPTIYIDLLDEEQIRKFFELCNSKSALNNKSKEFFDLALYPDCQLRLKHIGGFNIWRIPGFGTDTKFCEKEATRTICLVLKTLEVSGQITDSKPSKEIRRSRCIVEIRAIILYKSV